MVLSYGFLFSCKYTQTKKDDTPQENSTPSADEHQKSKSVPKKDYPIPDKSAKDSILKKRKKSKDLDTLKPQVALL